MAYSESDLRQAVPCPGGTLYSIRPGDTFFELARRFGTTVNAIAAANPGVNPNNLQIGQVICIPVPATAGPCPPGTFAYIIQAGDTFFELARRFGTTVAAITAANPGVNPNNLQIGQVICIPTGAITPPPIVFAFPCCAVLSAVPGGGAPGAEGSVLIRFLAPDLFSATFAASGLPEPQVFGNFDRYVGDVLVPQAPPEPPVAFGALLERSAPFEQPPTWAGTREFPDEPTTAVMVDIRLFSTVSGRPGPVVLQGTLAGCGS